METESADVSVGSGTVSYASCSHSAVVLFLILLGGRNLCLLQPFGSMGVIMPHRPNLLRFI